MLHQDVLMSDLDVDQWRNAQSLLLRSAKGCRRIVVIHDNGVVAKCRHTAGVEIVAPVSQVVDPQASAQSLYEANAAHVDFVVIMERSAVDAYFARVQDSWQIDDDLDVFVQRTYAALDDFSTGIVTYPGSARENLGLQWRLGASLDEVNAAAAALVAAHSTAILGVEREGELWTSLLLDFDADNKITSIATADPTEVDIRGPRAQLAQRLVDWAEGKGKTVSVAVVFAFNTVHEFLAATGAAKGAAFAAGVSAGSIAVAKAPAGLS